MCVHACWNTFFLVCLVSQRKFFFINKRKMIAVRHSTVAVSTLFLSHSLEVVTLKRVDYENVIICCKEDEYVDFWITLLLAHSIFWYEKKNKGIAENVDIACKLMSNSNCNRIIYIVQRYVLAECCTEFYDVKHCMMNTKYPFCLLNIHQQNTKLTHKLWVTMYTHPFLRTLEVTKQWWYSAHSRSYLILYTH